MISHLDHLVLTVRSIPDTVAFYTRVLGLQEMTFGAGRTALAFGNQKINLHQSGHEFEPKAGRPTPGSADLCFISQDPIAVVEERLKQGDVEIIEGPVPRTGALGAMTSLYIRDPDQNLIEISTYTPSRSAPRT